MDKFLETLQSRLAEAQKRFLQTQEAFKKAQADMNQFQQTFVKAQTEFQSASQEFNSWQVAVNIESQKQEASRQSALHPMAASAAKRITPQMGQEASTSTLPASALPPPPSANANPEINKTAWIRQILKDHPAGITPGELWKEVAGQLTNRPYLYSILKRLKDNEEVSVRRGKYFLKSPVIQEAINRASVVQ